MAAKSKEKAATGIGILTPLLGLGAQIATAVPLLRKPPKVKAEVPGYTAAAIPAGMAQQGHGMGRGPALLQAFRQSGVSGQELGLAQARANFAASNANATNEIKRREGIAKFGVDLSSGMGDLAIGLVDVANARKAEREAGTGKPGDLGLQQPGSTQLQEPGDLQTEQPTAADVAQNPYSLQSAMMSPLMKEVEKQVQRDIRNKSEAMAQSRAALGMSQPEYQLKIAPEMQEVASQFNIAMDMIDKEGLDMALALPQLARLMGANAFDMLNPPIRLLHDELSMGDTEDNE